MALSVVFACTLHAQTYKVGPDASATPQSKTEQTSPPAQQLGWGSNIQNARLAGAAEAALKNGKHAEALDYAYRAAQASPNDPHLWFLLGYAARLNNKNQISADAYSRGLRLDPSSLDGQSGLAQTYSVMGRTPEAMRILNKIVAADPRRKDDVLLLGDLTMRSGDYEGALDVLKKAEADQPGARPELLLAICYQHLKQLDRAKHYLELAQSRAPDNADVQRSMAGYYLETADYPSAIASLKSIRSPKPDVVAELAYAYQLDGKQDDAAKLYTEAANAMPRDLGLQLSAARADVAIGSIDRADSFLSRAAGISADDYRLHAIRGEIAQLQEHNIDAVKEYNDALTHLPADVPEGPLYPIQLHMNLMALYQGLKQTSEAHNQLDIAQKAITALDEQGPGRAQFLRLRALIKVDTGDLNGASTDVKEALAINAKDPGTLQLDGDLLVKMGHPDEAIEVYKQILAADPSNRFALTSLGYAERNTGHDQEAEKYFLRLAETHPNLSVPYLALGDLYTARRDFAKAEADYSKGYSLAPRNALIVAGGMNAAIEAPKLDLAATWMSRATSDMDEEPQILREKERYLSFKGDYQQSADVAAEAIKVLPQDRDVVVYLGYDLLHLNRYDDLLTLTEKYNNVLPKEPDIPLLAGYVHKHDGQLEEARQDFTETLNRDPNIVTAYVNRGYVLHDLHLPQPAAADFEAALAREPNNGEAHLGLANASLDLHRPQVALKQAQLAEQIMGDSEPIHLIRATAYGQRGMLMKSAAEYRTAIKFTPNDGSLHLALAETLYSQREYHEAIDELQTAQKLSPDDPFVYATLARSYAQLQDREQAITNIQLAESHIHPSNTGNALQPSEQSGIYVFTGEALTELGDQNGAMERFSKALTAPRSDRVSVRLAIAQVMTHQGHDDDARRQIALAMMEAQAGDTLPATGQQLIEAADVFRGLHDYQLSQDFLHRAQAAGASETAVRIGLANNYLALGDTPRAKGELARIGNDADSEPDYQYLLAEANVYRQEHQGGQALTAFAQAANAAGDDQTAAQSLLEAGADEGLRINKTVSLLSDFSIEPIFEDSTVYVLDSKLDAAYPVPPTDTAQLPPPRSSLETQSTTAYHLHFNRWPTIGGFFQARNATGTISVPATNSIVSRNTTDSTFNIGLDPTVHLGNNAITFNGGIQATVRRDTDSPVQLNQNLFRLFAYVTTSSFFNALSVSGSVVRETGPFTQSNLHSQALSGTVDFRVGRPWGRTALVTGWGSNDQKFSPVGIENYYTSSYIGLERRFGDRLNVRAVAEDLRAWRVVAPNSGIAQALRPAGTVDFTPKRNWDVQARAAYTRTMSFHVYDTVQSGFSVSYAMPVHRGFKDEGGRVLLQYPIRFTGGLEEDTFINFTGASNQMFKPYIGISVF